MFRQYHFIGVNRGSNFAAVRETHSHRDSLNEQIVTQYFLTFNS
jgi:hypothetical protein